MCCCTPPGTSQVYGQTMPILMTGRRRQRRPRRSGVQLLLRRRPRAAGRAEVFGEDPLEHVPVLGVGRDARLEGARHLLRQGGDLVPPVPSAGAGISG